MTGLLMLAGGIICGILSFNAYELQLGTTLQDVLTVMSFILTLGGALVVLVGAIQ